MKRSLGALLVPCLALISIGMLAAPAVADIDTDQVTRSTVWVDVSWKGVVDVQYNDNTSQRYTAETATYCTGFIVSGTGHIATAGHCVRYGDTIRKGLLSDVIATNKLAPKSGQFDLDTLPWVVSPESTPTITIGQPSVIKDAPFDKSGITAQLVDSQDPEAGDNALVQVAGKDTTDTVLVISEQAPKTREHITAVGFPSDTARITDADRQPPTFKEGTISAEVKSKKGVPRLQLDGELIPGMSGGPTLNSDGLVVGINSSVFVGFNQSYITDTPTLRTFLEKNGVKLSTAGTKSSTPASSTANPQPTAAQSAQGNSNDTLTTVLVVAVCVLIALLVAGGIAFFVLQRRKSALAQGTASSQIPPPNSPNQGSSV